MKTTFKISDLSSYLFWDVDKSKLDFEKSSVFLTERVLEYGLMKDWKIGRLEDWKIIKNLYGLEKIKEITLQSRSFDDVTLSFLCTIFDLEKEAFRCYKLRQSNPHFM